MQFDRETLAAIDAIAKRHGFELAALLAVVDIESGGKVFATINGKPEPLIRFEGHYFDRRLTGEERDRARREGLASPTAGAVANPAIQAGRWKMLARAVAINAQAAYESCSYGVGQVMGAHWEWLGFGSVTELVNLCRSGVGGQVELMARFIDRSGLAGALRSRDWAAFARGYNGRDFARNAYDVKMAAAYLRYSRRIDVPAGEAADRSVLVMQERLALHGFPVYPDGVRGRQTDAALKAFQKARGLVVDGIAGSATWAALGMPTGKPSDARKPIPAPGEPAAPKDAPAATPAPPVGIPTEPGVVVIKDDTPVKWSKHRLLAWLIDLFMAVFWPNRKGK